MHVRAASSRYSLGCEIVLRVIHSIYSDYYIMVQRAEAKAERAHYCYHGRRNKTVCNPPSPGRGRQTRRAGARVEPDRTATTTTRRPQLQWQLAQ